MSQVLGDSIYISTYGCQMNVNDTERMYALMEMAGYEPVNSPDRADVILINSCSVREKPVHKVFSEVGRYRKHKLRNPRLKIGVAGCVAQQEKNKLIEREPLIDFVVGTDAIDKLPEVIREIREKDKKLISAKFEHKQPYQIETLIRNPGVSTYVNITKGCDNFCTFCVVPFTRGRERSRKLPEVIKDVQNLIARGVKEVTLLGQNVNSYRSECGKDFADLLEAVALETNIERIRYTTSHPKDFNLKLARVMRKYQPQICEHIHLPIQSGDDEVLARMNRRHTVQDYLKKVEMIFEEIPNAVLSTDIIVGFPGETEEQFENTLKLLDKVPYECVFAFKYSPRPFTKAARWPDQLSEKEKSQRLDVLLEKHKTLAFELAKKYKTQELDILVEKHHEPQGNISGRSSQNKLVYCPGDKSLIGSTVRAKIHTAFPNTLRGVLIDSTTNHKGEALCNF